MKNEFDVIRTHQHVLDFARGSHQTLLQDVLPQAEFLKGHHQEFQKQLSVVFELVIMRLIKSVDALSLEMSNERGQKQKQPQMQ